MTREGVMDIGQPPPEPEPLPEAKETGPTETFQQRALRRAQEAEARQKAAAEALEGFGTMVPPWAVKHYEELAKAAESGIGWYVELSGDGDSGDAA